MTTAVWLAFGSAFWLGVLTAISPCPLATNLAAISYVSHGIDRPGRVILAAWLYVLGRMAAYVLLAFLLLGSLLASPTVARWLQEYLHQFLGPLLVLVGMVLLGLLDLPMTNIAWTDGLRSRVDRLGLLGAGALGFVFALSFCPVSAALYFGSLIPLAIREQSRFLLPAVYGLGTALPVALLAIVLALGAHRFARAFTRIGRVEWWFRRGTGLAILVIGVYLTLRHVHGISL